MRSLAEARAVAVAAIARSQARDRVRLIDQSAQDVARRLQAAQDAVDARKRRQAAVQAVLCHPARIPLRSFPSWFAGALRDVPDDDREYTQWADWGRP